MIGKNIHETYGVRIWKVTKKANNEEESTLVLEYPYHTLFDIYKYTTAYDNEADLSMKIASNLKIKHSDLYDKNCVYRAQIVYYPNKEESKELININPNNTITNGETSEYMPILYSNNIDIFDDEKTKCRYQELVGNERFRKRISNLFWEKEGLSKIARAYRHSELQVDSEQWGIKLYDAISKGFKWYTAIYVIMNTEFEKSAPKQELADEIEEEVDTTLLKTSFRNWVLCPPDVQKIIAAEKPTPEELHWLGEFGTSGDIGKLLELQTKQYDKKMHK